MLPPLEPGAWEDLVADADLDGVELAGLEWPELRAERTALLECRLSGCLLDGRLDHGRWVSTVVADVRATTLDVSASHWRDVELRGGRAGALIAHGSSWSGVLLAGLKVDYLNLRGADVSSVLVSGCTFVELDLGAATVSDLAFTDCRVERLVVTGATLQRVSLLGLELEGVDGIGSLAGATVSEEQLHRLAPLLAAHLGVTIAGITLT